MIGDDRDSGFLNRSDLPDEISFEYMQEEAAGTRDDRFASGGVENSDASDGAQLLRMPLDTFRPAFVGFGAVRS